MLILCVGISSTQEEIDRMMPVIEVQQVGNLLHQRYQYQSSSSSLRESRHSSSNDYLHFPNLSTLNRTKEMLSSQNNSNKNSNKKNIRGETLSSSFSGTTLLDTPRPVHFKKGLSTNTSETLPYSRMEKNKLNPISGSSKGFLFSNSSSSSFSSSSSSLPCFVDTLKNNQNPNQDNNNHPPYLFSKQGYSKAKKHENLNLNNINQHLETPQQPTRQKKQNNQLRPVSKNSLSPLPFSPVLAYMPYYSLFV
jgi:hypothetical protein